MTWKMQSAYHACIKLTFYARIVKGSFVSDDVPELRHLGKLVRHDCDVRQGDPAFHRDAGGNHIWHRGVGEHDFSVFYRPDCGSFFCNRKGAGRVTPDWRRSSLLRDPGNQLRRGLRHHAGLLPLLFPYYWPDQLVDLAATHRCRGAVSIHSDVR